MPVENIDEAVAFYEKIMGFTVDSTDSSEPKKVLLSQDEVTIGISENGGDPTQEGCFFEVTDVEKAFEELKSNGLEQETHEYRINQHGETSFKVFVVVALQAGAIF